MTVLKRCNLGEFEAWSGAEETLERVIKEGKLKELELLLEEVHGEEIDDTTLNDILWFEDEWIFEQLGIEEEEE